MVGIYKIAGCNIKICSIHNDVHFLCRNYRSEDNADFTVVTTQGDIDLERKYSEEEDIKLGTSIRNYTDGYLETLAVYRKIADTMLNYDTILFHGSCVAVDGEGYLFTAKSGTGKSTHTRLWRELFGKRAVMVNDDKPLIRITDTGARVFGTPWNGKHALGENITVPLRAICVLERDAENHICKVEKRSIYPLLVQQTHRSSNGGAVLKMLTLLDTMTEKVGLYKLGCNMEMDAAKVAYEGMAEKK